MGYWSDGHAMNRPITFSPSKKTSWTVEQGILLTFSDGDKKLGPKLGAGHTVTDVDFT